MGEQKRDGGPAQGRELKRRLAAVVAHLLGEDLAVAREVAAGLRRQGEHPGVDLVAGRLVRELWGKDEARRLRAAAALVEIGPGTVPALYRAQAGRGGRRRARLVADLMGAIAVRHGLPARPCEPPRTLAEAAFLGATLRARLLLAVGVPAAAPPGGPPPDAVEGGTARGPVGPAAGKAD
jgi:hypothetical protein